MASASNLSQQVSMATLLPRVCVFPPGQAPAGLTAGERKTTAEAADSGPFPTSKVGRGVLTEPLLLPFRAFGAFRG